MHTFSSLATLLRLGLLMLSLGFSGRTLARPAPEAGILDLRTWNAEEAAKLPLRGEWEFHWSQLLTPEDFAGAAPDEKSLIQVPGSWNLKGHPLYGYATYRLRVQLDQARELAIRFPWIQAASRIYIDGVLIEDIGRVSADPSGFLPLVQENYWIFTPKEATFDIIVQAANYHSLMGGLAGTPTLGTVRAIKSAYIRDIALTLFCVGSLFVMGIYHFCLYAFRTRARSTLYFGCVCVLVSIFVFTSHLPSMSTFFPNLSQVNATRLYLVWTLAPAPFAYFFHELFPHRFPKTLAHALAVFYALMYAVIWIVAFQNIAPPLFLYQGVTASFGFYTFYAIIQAARRREDGARLLLAGVVILVGTSIHDMLIFLYDSINLTSFGLFTFILCQSALLARRFSHAFTQVETSEMEIRQLNESLEQRVDEKTRDIRAIMSHIQLGIFAITADRCRIHRDYSVHLKAIFEIDELTGYDATELLFGNCHLGSDEKSQAISALHASVGEDELAFAANVACLPTEIRRIARDGQERILELSWNAMIDARHTVEKILVTVRDVTALRELEEEASDRREELEFIGELINVPPDLFRRFLQSCHDLLSENRKLLDSRSIRQKDMEVLKVMFINMHTMKGAARSLYFKRMTRILHDVEQYYALLQKNPQAEWNFDKMKHDLDEVAKIISVYESVNHTKLGRSVADELTVAMKEIEVMSLYRTTERMADSISRHESSSLPILLQDMQRLMFPYIFVPARDVLTDIAGCLGTLAKDLHKAMPILTIEGDDVPLSHQGEQLLRKVLIHILRNSMDHGIEEPKERQQKGKDAAGRITFRLEKKESAIHIHYRDDGRGLDLGRIHQTAVAQGLLSPHAELSLQGQAELIFQSGLSTAVQVNDISGRGMGMEAVRRYLEQHQGSIQVHLQDGIPATQRFHSFSFELILPLSLAAENHVPLCENAA